MAKKSTGLELEDFKKYLKSDSNEDAKRPLLYPLFSSLFKEKFKIESDAHGADVYVEGQLIVEAKTSHAQWLEGFYQALHYQKKYGLAYNTILVVAKQFAGVWKVNKIPEYAVIQAHTSDATKAPNTVGKENARKTDKKGQLEIKNSAIYWLEPRDLDGDIFQGAKNLTNESFEILKILRNLDSDRLQVNTHNFINTIERMMPFFEHPIDAVHAFYTIVAYWDITATVAVKDEGNRCQVVGFKGSRLSDEVQLPPRNIATFKKFVEGQYVFTNEGSGLTVDYYFSRFDEVMAKIDPEYVKQHGIFFTDGNLSKFALWFVKQYFPGKLDEEYIVFDPAGGSGNLVSSWRGKLRHKIISELQPDLLRTIERRMRVDPFHLETGFTIIPKTSENKGLNFLDVSAEDYLAALKKELSMKSLKLDKPIAFLLNPPYKNTDENVKLREAAESEYEIHPSILDLTGADAGKERYLAFLGQILHMAAAQNKMDASVLPIVMIFTPTSWLIPRPTYAAFRKVWDKHFQYETGFIVTSNEFFNLKGKWPLAFSIWSFTQAENHQNSVQLFDFSSLRKNDLNIEWNDTDEEIGKSLGEMIGNQPLISFNRSRTDIRELLPLIEFRAKNNQSLVKQPRLNIYRNATKEEIGKEFISGFPRSDERHKKLNVPYGFADGEYIGFMDDMTPVRVRQDTCRRMSNIPDRVWFQLRPTFIDTNLTKVMPGTPDKYGYVAYDMDSVAATFKWFALTKALNNTYPLWANQFDIWLPNEGLHLRDHFLSLCISFVLAENRCVVTKYEAGNPVPGAPEVFVDNPLSTNNPKAFWNTTLAPFANTHLKNGPSKAGVDLAKAITGLYQLWNKEYCKGQFIYNNGLQDEPYFRYFDYPDFLTPNSGLIQIRKFADINSKSDLVAGFGEISALSKEVREELYRLLVDDFKYFE